MNCERNLKPLKFYYMSKAKSPEVSSVSDKWITGAAVAAIIVSVIIIIKRRPKGDTKIVA
jgi:hypothetical protein